jgi:hypothetical protein
MACSLQGSMVNAATRVNVAASKHTMRASLVATRVTKKGGAKLRVHAAGGGQVETAKAKAASNGAPPVVREVTRFAIPSKGRMAEDTQDLLMVPPDLTPSISRGPLQPRVGSGSRLLRV